MVNKFISLPAKKYTYVLIILVGAISIYSFYKPFVISIDSVYGFLAYKGSIISHSFNNVVTVSAQNINKSNLTFESWWSPGQWLYPGLLNYFFGTRLGVASIIITILSSVLGFWGYYKLFDFFKFPSTVSILSLLLIFSSCTFYYSFIIYQGGETLEFAFFPWFLLFVLRIEKINFFQLLTVFFLFILCYIAKTTLALYCSIILSYRSIQPILQNYIINKKINLRYKSLLLLIPILVSNLTIQYFFLSKGPRIGLFNHFNVFFGNIIIPLSSPLISILSIQQWILRVEKVVSLKNYFFLPSYIMYLLAFAAVVIAALKIYRQKNINAGYKWLLLFLYAGMCCFFITAYFFEANIDFNSRHFKLFGFLCVPGLLSIASQRLKPVYITIIVFTCCLLASIDIVYLKNKWANDRYISINYFYRNYDDLEKIDAMDKVSYGKLISLDKSIPTKDSLPVVFYIEGNTDLAMDVTHLCIMKTPLKNIAVEKYYCKGRVIIACITKRPFASCRDLLKNTFPDFNNFQLIDETNMYSFFKIF